MDKKIRKLIVAFCSLLGVIYLCGIVSQFITNYFSWQRNGGFIGEVEMKAVDFSPIACIQSALSGAGLKLTLIILVLLVIGFIYIRKHTNLGSFDSRGFNKSKTGVYGTAEWLPKKDLESVCEITSVSQAQGTILGELDGNVVCMPTDTRLNRHIAIFGASGTMKSRAVIRNALFQMMKRGESVIVTDTKGELFADTSKMFLKNGYTIRVFNLVTPERGDCWNCMSDLNGDTLLAQTLTNIIIGNTSNGKGDPFWDNGESNLLKALMLLVDQNSSIDKEDKHLATVYNYLTTKNYEDITAEFDRLDINHPAKAPYKLFSQASETVQTSIITGLGTRLQVLQNSAVQRITSKSSIDLIAPAQKKCIYYIILSDQDTTMSFLSSLFFSLMFIKLTRFADKQPTGRCPIPVNLVLDEFNNIGKLGGAADGSDFARALSTIRSRDIRVMIAVQSLGQLQNRYPNNLWAEIIGNCDIQLMLGCTDEVTAEYVSARSGDMSVEVGSTSVTKQTIAINQFIPQYRETEGQGRRRLLTPDEVLRLPLDELILIIRGFNITKLKKFDFTNHPYSKRIDKKSVLKYIPVDRRTTGEKKQASDEGANDESQIVSPPPLLPYPDFNPPMKVVAPFNVAEQPEANSSPQEPKSTPLQSQTSEKESEAEKPAEPTKTEEDSDNKVSDTKEEPKGDASSSQADTPPKKRESGKQKKRNLARQENKYSNLIAKVEKEKAEKEKRKQEKEEAKKREASEQSEAPSTQPPVNNSQKTNLYSSTQEETIQECTDDDASKF